MRNGSKALFLLVLAPSSELGLSSSREMGKCSFGGEFGFHCFDNISRSFGRILERRDSFDSLFHCDSVDTPLVGVEAFGGSGRGLECVGCGDLIVDAVLDAISVPVDTNTHISSSLAFRWRRQMVGFCCGR